MDADIYGRATGREKDKGCVIMTRRISAPLFVIENVDEMPELRARHGYTRGDVANQSGVKHDYISQYERGYCYPNKEHYNKLAEVFGWEIWQ